MKESASISQSQKKPTRAMVESSKVDNGPPQKRSKEAEGRHTARPRGKCSSINSHNKGQGRERRQLRTKGGTASV
jgi:hypothetical protein